MIRLRTCAVIVIATGLTTMLLSGFPFAQAAGDPGQANYAGSVATERREILLLGLSLAVVGAVAYWARLRWSLLLSLASAIAVGVVAVRTINDVAKVVADKSEIDSDVGWALYLLCACSIVAMVYSGLGLRARARHPA